MTISSFIGSVWSARLLDNFNKAAIYCQPQVSNRDYEGEIQGKGSTVKITSIGKITISSYTKDSDIADPEALNDAQSTLTASQAKYFNFAVGDVDKAQMSGNVMDGAMRESAWGLADVADQYQAGIMYAQIATANKIGADTGGIVPNTTAGTTTFDYLLQLGTKLSEANAPKQGRFVVVPPWYVQELSADARFTDISASGSGDALLNGFVKRAAGFDILESNNVPTVAGSGGDSGKTNYKIIAGIPNATTFADSVSKVEAYRPDKRFADVAKGLHVYGGLVSRPSCLALLTCRAVT